jgi:hypothetical protein
MLMKFISLKETTITIISSSSTSSNSHSTFANTILMQNIAARMDDPVTFKIYNLPSIIQKIPTTNSTINEYPGLDLLAKDFMESEGIILGAQNKNFSPSLHLQAFFHLMRPFLVTLEPNGKVLSRNFSNRTIGILLSGRSSKVKWYLLNQFIFFTQFNMLFDYWGPEHNDNAFRLLFNPQNSIQKLFIPDAQKTTFKPRRSALALEIEKFAPSFVSKLKTTTKPPTISLQPVDSDSREFPIMFRYNYPN